LDNAGGNKKRIAGLVALDFPGYDTAGKFGDSPFLENLFGGDLAVMKDASPMNHVGKHVARAHYLFIEAGRGEGVENDTLDMVSKLQAVGVQAERVFLENYSHSDVSNLLGDPNEKITQVVGNFLEKFQKKN